MDAIGLITKQLAAIHGVLDFERLSPRGKDIQRAYWRGITISREAADYIDASTESEGPHRWMREAAVLAAQEAGKVEAALEDVITIVYESAMENPPHYYNRDRIITPEGREPLTWIK